MDKLKISLILICSIIILGGVITAMQKEMNAKINVNLDKTKYPIGVDTKGNSCEYTTKEDCESNKGVWNEKIISCSMIKCDVDSWCDCP